MTIFTSERCVEDVLGNDGGELSFLSMLNALKKMKGQPKMVGA